MIEKKKISLNNAIFLMKHIAYNASLQDIFPPCFNDSHLCKRFKLMIIAEEQKKEGIKGKLLIDLCECYLLLSSFENHSPGKLISVCVSCLFKVALKKEENEEIRKEVEIALLALSRILQKIGKELYLKEIKEIIKYHQEHNNLTRLAYQSAWQFLINRKNSERESEDFVVNKLQFVREFTEELEELAKFVNLKKKEKKEKRFKEEKIIKRWFIPLQYICLGCNLRCIKEKAELITCFVRMYWVGSAFEKRISRLCVNIFDGMIISDGISKSVFVECKAVECILCEMCQSSLDDNTIALCTEIFDTLLERTNTFSNEVKIEEWKKMKRMMFEVMEERGFQDIILSFHETPKSLYEIIGRR